MTRRAKTRWVALLVLFALTTIAGAQLAITEVMSVTRLNSNTGYRGAEYWELTNFGTNDLSLHGYGFRDSLPSRPLVRSMFTNLTIRGGESIIFLRIQDAKQSVTNLSSFRAWWGETNLPASLQCRIWTSPGLSGWDGDEVWLYNSTNGYVDHVRFPRARLGVSFTYDAESGLFGTFSAAGLHGAFNAELANDVGSPGFTTGMVPAHIINPPASAAVDVNTAASFSVEASAVPRPRLQWYFGGNPIPGATQSVFSIASAKVTNAGLYQVWVSNGFSAVMSEPAALTVNTNPTPPAIVKGPEDATVFIGQAAVFTVEARGVPAVGYQWATNGVTIPGATTARLQFLNVPARLDGLQVSVRVTNLSGQTNASALLTVTPRPDIRFTEVMPLVATNEDNLHFDWFEVTNFDTNTVDLKGWRFSDELSFSRAVTVTNTLVLAPGRSAIFARRLDATRFHQWWGEGSLPGDLAVFTYTTLGLGAYGDQLFLWNGAATSPYDYLTSLSWAAATPGVSFEAEKVCADDFCLDEVSGRSIPGLRGAFFAWEGGHIGSPGYIMNRSMNLISISRRGADEVLIQAKAIAGRSYRLCRSDSASMTSPTPLPAQTATNNVLRIVDHPPSGDSWFYKLEELP